MADADRSDHVPASLLYGPVDSRRFGRSLGVSFSEPGYRACAWGCPYCQLGHLPDRPPEREPVTLERLCHDTAQALQNLDLAGLDVITLAGGGEPTDHPDFAAYVRWLAERIAGSGVRLVMLTNGDGLEWDENCAALDHIDATWVKWDPGAPQGSWARRVQEQHVDRYVLLSQVPELRIQSLVFERSDDVPGNATPEARAAWLADMRRLRPVEIHLTTVDRVPPDPAVCKVGAGVLEDWAQAARDALGIAVRVFA